MDKHDIVPSPLLGHLPDCFQERLRLDIAHCATDFHNSYICIRSIQRIDVAAIPFPNPETTPPVTKIYFIAKLPPPISFSVFAPTAFAQNGPFGYQPVLT